MGFMSDQLFDGRRIRAPRIVDCHSRESLPTEARFSFRAVHVVEVLSRLARNGGRTRPSRWTTALGLRAGYWVNGPTGVKSNWTYRGQGSPRAECLNTTWFLSLPDARIKLEAWRKDCNEARPHSAPGNPAPSQCASNAQDSLGGEAGNIGWTSDGPRYRFGGKSISPSDSPAKW